MSCSNSSRPATKRRSASMALVRSKVLFLVAWTCYTNLFLPADASESVLSVDRPDHSLVKDERNVTTLSSTGGRDLQSTINGYCAPPLAQQRKMMVAYRFKGRCERGGGESEWCSRRHRWRHLANKQCQAPGSECSTNKTCCSRLCVRCLGRCRGRCGLSQPTPRDSIFIFYYPWYASEAVDGEWLHWNADRRIGGGSYSPDDDDLPTAYYPRLGPYSSSNLTVLNQHMKWMHQAGIGVVVTSWWGAGTFEDERLWDVLDAADNFGLKVAFYVEPYGGGYQAETGGTRTPYTAMNDTKYLIDTYGCHRAVHRIKGRPVFFYFAAREYNHGKQDEWKLVWDTLHAKERYNPVVITQDTDLKYRVVPGGWDGGHEYGCRAAIDDMPRWAQMAQSYDNAGKILFMNTCPGGDKSRMSPGTEPVISRQNGQLYATLWKGAIQAKTKSTRVVITSFNEWHEGTQIEPAIALSIPNYNYKNYEGAWGRTGLAAANEYLTRTRKYGNQFLLASV